MNPATFMHTNDFDRLRRDIESSARLAEVPHDAAAIEPVLEAYRDFYTGSAVSFRTNTQPTGRRSMSVRYVELMVPHDAHAIAQEHGLLPSTGHPVARLCPTLQSSCAVAGYGVDASTQTGLEKIWTVLGQPLTVAQAAAVDGVPRAIGTNAAYFGKHDLALVSLFAIDFIRKSTNIYFMIKDPAAFLPSRVRSLIGELDFELPTEEVLSHCAKARAVYYTLHWDSPQVQRLCFGVIAPDPSQVPIHLDPAIQRYTGDAPSLAPNRPFIYSPTFARSGNYFKIENDYTGSMTMLMAQAAEMMP